MLLAVVMLILLLAILNVFKLNIGLKANRVKRTIEHVQLIVIRGLRDSVGMGNSGALPHFFLRWISKILVPKELRSGYPTRSSQNLEPQGLTGKILRNKELARYSEPVLRASSNGLGWQPIMADSFAFSGVLSKGRSSHGSDEWLWKSLRLPHAFADPFAQRKAQTAKGTKVHEGGASCGLLLRFESQQRTFLCPNVPKAP